MVGRGVMARNGAGFTRGYENDCIVTDGGQEHRLVRTKICAIEDYSNVRMY